MYVFSNKSDAQSMVQVLFQNFPVTSVFVANPWVPIVLGHNLTSGIVANFADTVTSVALVIDFQLIHEAISILPFGANDMTETGLDQVTQVRCVPLLSLFSKAFHFQSLKKAIDLCPESHRAQLIQGVLVAGRVNDLSEYLDSVTASGLCSFNIPAEPSLMVWKGLSVIGDMPSEIRENPHVKV